MSFDVVKKDFSKEHFWYVEIDVDGTTYRFCENRSPLPNGLDAIPTLQSVNPDPTEIDLTGGFGVRAGASISISDHVDYSIFGTVSNPVRFWPTWRANHPYYKTSPFRVYSGYIVNGTYDPSNFTERQYITESFAFKKRAAFKVRDPLQLANDKKSVAPNVSNGSLLASLTDSATNATLDPVGIGAEYPANGFIRIKSEVVGFLRSGDALTLSRGEYNTAATSHDAGDTCQICIEYNDTVDNIIYDLLINYANIDPAFIDLAAWQAEREVYLPGLYSTLITEPIGVTKLCKELGEQAPHFLFWKETTSLIEFVATKEPPSEIQVYSDESNILENSVSVEDMPDMRISSVIVNYGQFDPTKKLDEFNNYQQSYIRIDGDSVTNYGEQAIKIIYSRWLSSLNNAGARLLAARMGRRFSDVPRKIGFSLDAKDSSLWAGDNATINTADIVDLTGSPVDTQFQIISAQESSDYNYAAIEYLYGPSLPQDEDVDDPGKVVVLAGELTNINLRTIFDGLFPSIDPSDDVRFILDPTFIGGSTTINEAIDTGTWPELTTPPIIINKGLIVGRAGSGSQAASLNDGTDGGLALKLSDDIRLDNVGIIGGGGGGGGNAEGTNPESGNDAQAGGGSGAGFIAGSVGSGTSPVTSLPQVGSTTAGGDGGVSINIVTATGGDGGGLGQNGQSGSLQEGTGTTTNGGIAGDAIQLNGFTITYINAGDIRGNIS